MLDVFALQFLLGVFASLLVFAAVAWYLEIKPETFCRCLLIAMPLIILLTVVLWGVLLC